MLPAFAIRDLRGLDSSPSFVRVSKTQYDDTLHEEPTAALTYLDDDDGETITVGSGFELEQRLQEPVIHGTVFNGSWSPRSASPTRWNNKVHVFDIQHSRRSLATWHAHEANFNSYLQNRQTFQIDMPDRDTGDLNVATELANNAQSCTNLLDGDPVAAAFATSPLVCTNFFSRQSQSPNKSRVCESDSSSAHGSSDTLQNRTELTNKELDSPGVEAQSPVDTSATPAPQVIEPFEAFSSLLLDAADLLQQMAQKTREADITPVHGILEGFKDIFSEVSNVGIQAFKELDKEATILFEEYRAAKEQQVKAQTQSLSQDEIKSTVSSHIEEDTLLEDLAVSSTADGRSQASAVSEDKSPSVKKVMFDEPKSAMNEVTHRETLSHTPKSIMDAETIDSDFSRRFPPLISLRRAKSVGSFQAETSRASTKYVPYHQRFGAFQLPMRGDVTSNNDQHRDRSTSWTANQHQQEVERLTARAQDSSLTTIQREIAFYKLVEHEKCLRELKVKDLDQDLQSISNNQKSLSRANSEREGITRRWQLFNKNSQGSALNITEAKDAGNSPSIPDSQNTKFMTASNQPWISSDAVETKLEGKNPFESSKPSSVRSQSEDPKRPDEFILDSSSVSKPSLPGAWPETRYRVPLPAPSTFSGAPLFPRTIHSTSVANTETPAQSLHNPFGQGPPASKPLARAHTVTAPNLAARLTRPFDPFGLTLGNAGTAANDSASKPPVALGRSQTVSNKPRAPRPSNRCDRLDDFFLDSHRRKDVLKSSSGVFSLQPKTHVSDSKYGSSEGEQMDKGSGFCPPPVPASRPWARAVVPPPPPPHRGLRPMRSVPNYHPYSPSSHNAPKPWTGPPNTSATNLGACAAPQNPGPRPEVPKTQDRVTNPLAPAFTDFNKPEDPRHRSNPFGANPVFNERAPISTTVSASHPSVSVPKTQIPSRQYSATLQPLAVSPEIKSCVSTLRGMGYGLDNPHEMMRLELYATLAKGDVWAAVDLIEEDRTANRE